MAVANMSSFMKCRLTRLSQREYACEDVFEGETFEKPTVGREFRLTNDNPRDRSGGCVGRIVETDPVWLTESCGDGSVRFRTRNSEYLFEVIG